MLHCDTQYRFQAISPYLMNLRVTLQRQIDGGLMEIHLKFTEFCCLFGPEQFSAKKKVGSKQFWDDKNFWVKIFLGSNKF